MPQPANWNELHIMHCLCLAHKHGYVTCDMAGAGHVCEAGDGQRDIQTLFYPRVQPGMKTIWVTAGRDVSTSAAIPSDLTVLQPLPAEGWRTGTVECKILQMGSRWALANGRAHSDSQIRDSVSLPFSLEQPHRAGPLWDQQFVNRAHTTNTKARPHVSDQPSL